MKCQEDFQVRPCSSSQSLRREIHSPTLTPTAEGCCPRSPTTPSDHPHSGPLNARLRVSLKGLEAQPAAHLPQPKGMVLCFPTRPSAHPRSSATEFTPSVCPSKVLTHFPLLISHSRRVLSQLPDKAQRPSALRATEYMLLCVSLKGPEALPAAQFPQRKVCVPASRQRPAPIPAQRHGIHAIRVSLEGSEALPAAQFPQRSCVRCLPTRPSAHPRSTLLNFTAETYLPQRF